MFLRFVRLIPITAASHTCCVVQAQAFLKSILFEWGLSSAWVTSAWVEAQFKLVNTDHDAQTVTAEEFQGFCESISKFCCHLGPAMGVEVPANEQDVAPREDAADCKPTMGDAEPRHGRIETPSPHDGPDDKGGKGCQCAIV